jgi:hypothetical protein
MSLIPNNAYQAVDPSMLPMATGPLRTSGSSSRLPWSFANPTTRADHRYGP